MKISKGENTKSLDPKVRLHALDGVDHPSLLLLPFITSTALSNRGM